MFYRKNDYVTFRDATMQFFPQCILGNITVHINSLNCQSDSECIFRVTVTKVSRENFKKILKIRNLVADGHSTVRENN